MIKVDEKGIVFKGNKNELVGDLVNLIYLFQDIVPLDKDEIRRLEVCFGPMLRQESVEGYTKQFNLEQRTKIIDGLYNDLGIKRMNTIKDSDGNNKT